MLNKSTTKGKRRNRRRVMRLLGLAAVLAVCGAGPVVAQDVPVRTLELPPAQGNPRNSEGAFVTLRDGRVLYVYTRFTGGGGDHDSAHLAGRYSIDGGRTWTGEDRMIIKNEGGMNVMSASLLRLQSGEIALFYLLKNSERDCRPVMRLSSDEGATWGEPVMCVTDEVGYYVMNNDRAIQLKGGRLVVPVCLHTVKGSEKLDFQGMVMCYVSDDNGKTWRRGKSAQKGFNKAGRRITLQEPGVVELKDGRVMMFIRTNQGCQYLSFSEDGGDVWTPPAASDITSPLSPASIKRLPSTGDLLLVWNDHTRIPPNMGNRRVPLSTAISKDDGKTWQHAKALEGNPFGWYCYIAVHPMDDAVLLGYCAMKTLAHCRITRVPMSWLYADLSADKKREFKPVMFGSSPVGAFERLETPNGVWTAEAGHAEIHVYMRGKGVRLMGGNDRAVIFTSPKPVPCGALAVYVERFTAGKPYEVVMEAKVGDAWQKVWSQGEDAQAGMVYGVACETPELEATHFRFRCTSALGVIIQDFPMRDFGGFFND